MTPDAIVIGGGFAGLSAAAALAERGARVLVLEARPSLGGRATAFTDPATGERVDNGQHVLLGCYHETFRFLRRVGAADGVEIQDRLTIDIVDRAGEPTRLACVPLPPPFNLLGGLLTWSALGWRDRVAALRMRSAIREATHQRLPEETVRHWLNRYGQTARLTEVLWEPLALAALNQSIDVAAAAPFARVLAEMLTGSARDASLALPTRPLDELYAYPAQAFIERNRGEVRTGAPARITIVGAEIVVTVRGEELRAPRAICAVPWFALSETFPQRPLLIRETLSAADRVASVPIVTVNLWFDRPVTDRPLIGLPGRAMQWAFDKSRVFREAASHLSLVSSGAEAIVRRANGDLIDLALSEVTHAIPAARSAVLRRAVVVREKHATFSMAPGQPSRPSIRTDIPGLFLAGDWIDTGLPATIEGAVRSGHLAAEAAC